jgi:hypothetical protein
MTALHERNKSHEHPLSASEGVIFAATLSASAALLLIIFLPTLSNKMYLADDLGEQNIPFRYFYAQGLHAGRIDLWNPALFYGFYAHAEGQTGMFHPFHLLLYRFIPFIQAFGLELLINYLMLWLGSYFLFHRWTSDRVAAAFGAFVFTFAGQNAPAIVHVNRIAVIAHIPWMLFALDHCIRGEKRCAIYWFGAVALLNGSAILFGYPYFFGLTLALQIWYAAYLLVEKASISRVLLGAGGAALGLLIGAIQLIPTWQYLQTSSRAHPDLAFLSESTLRPANIFQWVNPYFFAGRALGDDALREISIYAGIGPFLLFLWLCTRKPKVEGLLPRFLLGLAALGMFLSIGARNRLFVFYSRLPGFNLFRDPSRFALFTLFAFAAGSALALNQLRKNPPPTSSRLLHVLTICLLILSLLTVAPRYLPIPLLSRYASLMSSESHVAAGSVIVCTGIVLFWLALRHRGWWLAAFCVLALCDLGRYAGTLVFDSPTGGLNYYKEDAPPVPPPAILANGSDSLTIGGYRILSAYAGLEPTQAHSMSDPNYLQALGATAIQDISGAWTILPLPPSDPVRFEQPLYSTQPQEAMNHVDLTKVAVVVHPVDVDPSAVGSVRIAEEHPGFVQIAAQSSGKMFCALVQRFHPGWTAEIDGQSLDLMPVDGDLTGFVFPGGRHIVTLVFHPNDFSIGRDITLIALLLLAIALLAKWLIDRRRLPRDNNSPPRIDANDAADTPGVRASPAPQKSV